MNGSRLAALLVAASVSLALGAANAPQDARTLKDLQARKVQVRKDAPSDSNAGKAMENYRRFLELQKTDPALRAEALRRLGDLSLESGELERLEREARAIRRRRNMASNALVAGLVLVVAVQAGALLYLGGDAVTGLFNAISNALF